MINFIIRSNVFLFIIGVLVFSFLDKVYANTTAGTFNPVGALLRNFNEQVLQNLTGLLVGAAVVSFFYGIVVFIIANVKGDSTKLNESRNWMLWSIFALFCMVSIWGIIRFFQVTLLPGQNMTTIEVPRLEFNSGGVTGSGLRP